MTMIMVVQGLPIDRGDDREGELVIVGESDFRNGSRYIRLPDSRTYVRMAVRCISAVTIQAFSISAISSSLL